MEERIIRIDSIDPVELYGVNDEHLRLVRKYFPDVKIVARGGTLRLKGSDGDLDRLARSVEAMIRSLERHGTLTEGEVESIVSGGEAPPVAIGAEGGAADVIVYGQNGLMVKARTANQRRMVESYAKHDMLFAIGPAGTGKTYTAVALAVRALKDRQVRRIVLTRPAVEAGEHLGFLPGDLREKIDPYLQPLYDALYDMIPAAKLRAYLDSGVIQVAPLAFMRGRTLDNAFVILDEAQNATESQLKMFLTRMGPNAKFIITGDVTQVDLPRAQPSGLLQAEKLLKDVDGIDFIYLDKNDVIRHKLVKSIIEAYQGEG